MATETMEQGALNIGRTFVWHEVYVAKAQPAIDFYTQALGFGTQSTEMSGGGGTYTMLTVNGMPVGGIMATSEFPDMKDVPPHWAVYLAVDDLDARLAKCLELGAKVVVPTMDIPAVGRMALIEDPQGAHIWLFKGAAA